ncbi:MAG: hypothetical protein SFU86_03390 [Pirellulaceae bacterium]|nr:hypothetical protein [Pirellulaceae bacterium]
MWRAFFLAIGIFSCVIGAQCLVVDTFVMAGEPATVAAAPRDATPASLFGSPAPAPATLVGGTKKNVKPPEWAPWSLLSAGAVIILYSLTLNRAGA